MLKSLFLICGLFITFYGQTCSCIGKESIPDAYKSSDLVVKARVISVQKIKIWSDTSYVKWDYNPAVDTLTFEQYKFEESIYGFHQLEYTVVVESSFKGAKVNDTLQIRTEFGHGDCGFPFIVGKQYLIYAVPEYSIEYTLEKLGRSKKELRGIFNTSICDRTRTIEDAGDDLRYLKSK